jgi:hypothetical protein
MTLTEFETLTIAKMEVTEGKHPEFAALTIETKDASKYSFIISKAMLKEFKESI